MRERAHMRWTGPLACGVLVALLTVLIPFASNRNVAATRERPHTDAKAAERLAVPGGGGASPAAAGVAHRPRYLPKGARPAPITFPKAGAPLMAYCLPGRANANTIPPGGPTEENYSIVHSATCLGFFYMPAESNGRLPPSLAFGPSFSVSQTTVSGHPARLTMPSRGVVGLYQLEWMASGLRFTLRVDRLRTPEGVSGIPLTELRRVANSVT